MSRSLKRVMRQRNTQIATRPVAATAYSFADMYDAHLDEVYRFVHRPCRDHSLSEDITQETFVTAIRTTNDPRSITIGWLLTVARNRLYDVLRRQSKYKDKLRLLTAENPGGHDAELAERLRVESALNELSVEYRLVLTLHYIDGLTGSRPDGADSGVAGVLRTRLSPDGSSHQTFYGRIHGTCEP